MAFLLWMKNFRKWSRERISYKLGEPADILPADLYDIAFRFLKSERLDVYELSCLPAAINKTISELGNKRIVATEKLSELLSHYHHQVSSNELLIGTWWRLFQAYFNISIDEAESIPAENKKITWSIFK